METDLRLPRGFARSRLPWLVAAAALILYGLTLNRWLNPRSLYVVAQVAGWETSPVLAAPVHYLVTLPFRLLPGGVLPVALNLLAAACAAATLALLARAVALLPYDRTREARLRERGEGALLSIPLAWVGPLFAVLLCGLQLTFWEHATAATGEMLDLLLFAAVIACLLEFRLTRQDRWLYGMALLYGLAVTNNHAMIAFFPCFLVALVWIKGFDFFNRRFLGRMAGLGAAGLLWYLLLPAVAVATHGEATFWIYLRTVLASQKAALASMPSFAVLLISLSTVLPVLLMGVRWRAEQGDTSRVGAVMAAFMTRFLHAVMLAAAVSVFLDPVWSPRALGFGRAMLPFYYLAALAAGYYTGYLLLMAHQPTGRAAYLVTPGMRLAGRVLAGASLAAAMVMPAVLLTRNLAPIRASNGRELARLADRISAALPARDAFIFSDEQTSLLLCEAALARRGRSGENVLFWSQLMPYRIYHKQLHARYGDRWRFGAQEGLPERMDPLLLSALVGSLAASNQVFYLHPSLGYYFEEVELQPAGLIFRVVRRPPDVAARQTLSDEERRRLDTEWEALKSELQALAVTNAPLTIERQYAGSFYSRALTSWGALWQRHGDLDRARHWLELAAQLNPTNAAARWNLAFNEQLRAGTRPSADPGAEADNDPRHWARRVVEDGFYDHPRALFALGELHAIAGEFRQALEHFRRLQSLIPDNADLQVWAESLEALNRLRAGDVEDAEARVLALRQRHPRDERVLEALTQVYLGAGRLTNALESIEAQLALNPTNRGVLLNKAALLIRLKEYDRAIPPLDTLLQGDEKDTLALHNRAIAHLQAGRLAEAERDYQRLREFAPRYYPAYYGLGEIALRRQDRAAALRYFQQYLKYGDPASTEYQQVSERVRQLKRGG